MTEIEQLLTDAAGARQRGQPAEETRLLERALVLAPRDPRALNARGMRALADRDFARAHTAFIQAAEADRGQPALWSNAATAARALGDDAGERAALERALDADRRHFIAILRLAELHERRGEGVEAALRWRDIVQMASAIAERPPAVEDALMRGQAFLAAHNDELATKLAAGMGGDLAALGTAAKRVRACIDHSLGRRPIYRNECAGVHFPFLPAEEFFERDRFPWFAALEAETGAIRAEALTLIERGGEAIRPYVRQDKGTPANKWSALDGSLDWSAIFLWEYGAPNEAVTALAPRTAAALDAIPQTRIPGKAPSAFFSILKPGAHIPAHTGVTNTRAIVHLPLVVPAGCRFRVGGETRAWREGEAFAFDDTIEHEAWNDSAEPRIVLIFDVWNPNLTADEQAMLVKFFEIAGG